MSSPLESSTPKPYEITQAGLARVNAARAANNMKPLEQETPIRIIPNDQPQPSARQQLSELQGQAAEQTGEQGNEVSSFMKIPFVGKKISSENIPSTSLADALQFVPVGVGLGLGSKGIGPLSNLVRRESKTIVKTGSADIGLNIKPSQDYQNAKLFTSQTRTLPKPDTIKEGNSIYELGKTENYFHGSGKNTEDILTSAGTKSVSVSPSKQIAEGFGRNLYEIGISSKARVINLKDVPSEITSIHEKSPEQYDKAIRAFALKNKIDVIKGDPFYGDLELQIFNKNVIKKAARIKSSPEGFQDYFLRTREEFAKTNVNLGKGIGRIVNNDGRSFNTSKVTPPSKPSYDPFKSSGEKEVSVGKGVVQIVRTTQKTKPMPPKSIFKQYPIFLGKSEAKTIKVKVLPKTQSYLETQKYLNTLQTNRLKTKQKTDQIISQKTKQAQQTKVTLMRAFKTTQNQKQSTGFKNVFGYKQPQRQKQPRPQLPVYKFPNPQLIIPKLKIPNPTIPKPNPIIPPKKVPNNPPKKPPPEKKRPPTGFPTGPDNIVDLSKSIFGKSGSKKGYTGNVPEFSFTGMYNRSETIYGKVKNPKSLSSKFSKIL